MAIALPTLLRGSTGLELSRTPLSRYIEDEMLRRGYDKKAPFARAAGISVTYLDTLLTGRNPETGAEVEPSPRILRQLAQAFARGSRNVDEEELVYADLMGAAGYLPRMYQQAAPREDPIVQAEIRRQAVEEAKRELMDALDRITREGHEPQSA